MPDLVVHSHWIVAAFTPSADPTDTDNPIGVLGAHQSTVYKTMAEAQTAARAAAASTPGTFYTVYEANWYCTTDITPVKMFRVGTIIQEP